MAAVMCVAALGVEREYLRRIRRNAAFEMPDKQFRMQYRLTKIAVRRLCEEIRPRLERNRDRGLDEEYVLTVEDEVLVTLLFYGSGNFQRTLASNYEHGMSQASVSRAIRRVTDAIFETKRDLIFLPVEEGDVAAIKASFLESCGLPDILGAVDCTHVKIQSPAVERNAYLNRKFEHSINVQLICDNNARIRDVVANAPGGTHDSFIWRFSGAFQRFLEHKMPRGYILGDGGYPLQPWLMVPFDHPVTPEQIEYNKRHASGRNVIERTNGILKSRFRCLDSTGGILCYKPARVCRIISACCILHNMCLDEDIPLPLTKEQINAAITRLVAEHLADDEDAEEAMRNNNLLRQGQAKRLELLQLFNN